MTANTATISFVRWARHVKSEGGQAAFEFLLMLPLFIGMTLFVVDLGVCMYEYVSLSNGVREGARFAAVNCGSVNGYKCTAPAVQQIAQQHSGGGFFKTSEFTPAWQSSSPDRGEWVSVSGTHRYDFIFFPGVNWDLHACSEMRLEQKDAATTLPTGSECQK